MSDVRPGDATVLAEPPASTERVISHITEAVSSVPMGQDDDCVAVPRLDAVHGIGVRFHGVRVLETTSAVCDGL